MSSETLLVDTHSHIYDDRFAEDLDQVIERAREAGVGTIIVPATKPAEFERTLELARRYKEVEAAIGIHPHHAAEVEDRAIDLVESIAAEGRAIAIGEAGLDYYYDFAPRERQHEVFRRQLRIARRLGLPAVIHNRESDDDLLRILEEEQDGSLRFQLHCFSSGPEVLSRALELGAMISFTGNITFRNSTLDEIVAAVPEDRIMIETDAPYMTPVPLRGKRNEPAYVRHVAERVALARGISLEKAIQMTTDNARRFFKILLSVLMIATGASVAHAQGGSGRPIRTIDTVVKDPFYKLVGVGGHLAFSSYIAGSNTYRNSLPGSGFWLTVTPLQTLDIDWLQLDLIYTAITDDRGGDSTYTAVTGSTQLPNNYYSTVDVALRFVPNPRNIFSFHMGIGLTFFTNEFGIDKWYLDTDRPVGFTDYRETAVGLNGSLGISLNFDTPYGLISPLAEWRVQTIMSDRDLPHRQEEFFVSQPRVGLLLYPNFARLFQ